MQPIVRTVLANAITPNCPLRKPGTPWPLKTSATRRIATTAGTSATLVRFTLATNALEREETSLPQVLMIQRQCPHCSNELVRARRADQQSVPIIAHVASPGWRCSVCGGEFTTEQIRDSRRAKSAAMGSCFMNLLKSDHDLFLDKPGQVNGISGRYLTYSLRSEIRTLSYSKCKLHRAMGPFYNDGIIEAENSLWRRIWNGTSVHSDSVVIRYQRMI